jgi:Ca2+-transporting ATPase
LILQLAAVYWPVLQTVLRTVPLTVVELVVVAACSLATVVVVEAVKLLRRRAEPRAAFV